MFTISRYSIKIGTTLALALVFTIACLTLPKETYARTSLTDLQNQIDAEEATRAAADSDLQDQIDNIQRVGTVTSEGQVWMDRNLGALRVAGSRSDSLAYGWLYQWGRLADGHESRTSPTTSTTSSTDVPGHGYFITTNATPFDWRDPQNDNLWQGVSGINNPCPAGFRLPTETELNIERLSWASNDSAGAFASPLKLVVAGDRFHLNGALSVVGSGGSYWSSTVDGVGARHLLFDSGGAIMTVNLRARGFSVRCLQD